MDLNLLLFIISIALSAITLGIAVYALRSMMTINKLRAQMGPEHQPENLEDILSAVVGKIKNLESLQEQTGTDLHNTSHQTGLSVKKVGLVKFNSFTDEGGNLSFSLALLDSQNDGVVMTSLHGRQQNRIYAKAVKGSVGEVPFNDEEQQAVMLAVTEHKNQTPNQNNSN